MSTGTERTIEQLETLVRLLKEDGWGQHWLDAIEVATKALKDAR